jgi:hypothetical protein
MQGKLKLLILLALIIAALAIAAWLIPSFQTVLMGAAAVVLGGLILLGWLAS